MAILSPEQKAALAAELAKPEYDGLSPAEAASRLNAAPVTVGPATRKRVPVGVIQTKAYELGLMYPLNAAADVPATAAFAKTVLGFFNGLHLEDTDMDKAKFREMLAGLKQIGVTNAESEAALLALADVPGVVSYGPTPFQALFGDARFVVASGEGPLAISTTVSGTCLPEMIEEARS